jgi:prepilin-type N-terminal cleavage/methylation domain-containing protein
MSASSRPETTASDAGFSLAEVLVSVVILGIVFTGLLTAMGTAALSSGDHRDQTDGHVLLFSAEESVKDEGRNPFNCDVSTYNPTRGVTLPDGWSAANVSVESSSVQFGYWSAGAFRILTTGCVATTPLERITLIATSPDGRANERLTFLKRRS